LHTYRHVVIRSVLLAAFVAASAALATPAHAQFERRSFTTEKQFGVGFYSLLSYPDLTNST
jgi:hypothetical protein